MVQGWIEDGVLGMRRLASPSVQLFVDQDTVCLYDMTEQILSEQSVHEGNISRRRAQQFPELERELWRQAGIAGTWLHRQGYRGTGSVDFLIVERKGRLETIICEINARVTGATYPAFLARHFRPRKLAHAQYRLSQTFSRNRPHWPDRSRRSVVSRRRRRRIIPFNFNTNLEGKVLKGQFVGIADQMDECRSLFNRAWSELPVEWGYDRD